MMTEPATARPPSRFANPFATCWTRPGAIPFQFAGDDSAEQFIARFAAWGWRGAIVGPHGSGKSTLLATLLPALRKSGWHVSAVALRDGRRQLPRDYLSASLSQPRPLVVVDGYEQLSRASQLMLRWRCRRAGAGLLVTAHAAVDLPTVYRAEVALSLAHDIVSTLTARIASPISVADVVASHARCGSNLRELLFELYERHEVLRRKGRTGVA